MMLVAVETSDEDGLIRAAAQGDRPAFGELYLRYARMVHGILLARVPAGDAEDLVQDVFLSAMRQLRGLREGAQIIIGTPGRVMDHMRRGTLPASASPKVCGVPSRCHPQPARVSPMSLEIGNRRRGSMAPIQSAP